MKNLSIDVSTFSTIINGNYVYVDKTKHIYNLFARGARYYFLSRPRRFGKSLLISTLKEFFLGNKHLFFGLWLSTSDYSWKKHFVIHLDFSVIAHSSAQELSVNLSRFLDITAQSYGINTQAAPSASAKLYMLITSLAQEHGPNSVVVLIDEYDKPLLDHLHNLKAAEEQREVLRSFYDVLKGLDSHLRALFITGVSKFSKASLFSGINNLNDISLDEDAADILGYTYQEMQTNYFSFINAIAQEEQKQVSEITHLLEYWYNGYRFSEKTLKVYNPFSILYYLTKKSS